MFFDDDQSLQFTVDLIGTRVHLSQELPQIYPTLLARCIRGSRLSAPSLYVPLFPCSAPLLSPEMKCYRLHARVGFPALGNAYHVMRYNVARAIHAGCSHVLGVTGFLLHRENFRVAVRACLISRRRGPRSSVVSEHLSCPQYTIACHRGRFATLPFSFLKEPSL